MFVTLQLDCYGLRVSKSMTLVVLVKQTFFRTNILVVLIEFLSAIVEVCFTEKIAKKCLAPNFFKNLL